MTRTSFDDALLGIAREVAPYAAARVHDLTGGLVPEQVEKLLGGGGNGPGGGNPPTKPTFFGNTTATLTITNNLFGTRTNIFERTVSFGEVSESKAASKVPTFAFGLGDMNTFLFALEREGIAPRNGIGVRFTTENAPFAWPAEAQLYARDPEDVGRFAESLPTDPRTIRQQLWTPAMLQSIRIDSPPQEVFATLPDALSLLSPAGMLSYLEQITYREPPAVVEAKVDPLVPADFFGFLNPTMTGITALDAAASPTGSGSVKAARIIYPGRCTSEQLFARDVRPDVPRPPGSPGRPGDSPRFPVPGPPGQQVPELPHVYKHLDDALHDVLIPLCESLNAVNLLSMTAFPVLRHVQGEERDSRGQLFVNIDVMAASRTVAASGIGSYTSGFGSLPSSRVRASVLFDIELDARGALVVQLAPLAYGRHESPLANPNWWEHGQLLSGSSATDPLMIRGWVDSAGRVTSGAATLQSAHIGDISVPLLFNGQPWNTTLDTFVRWFLADYLRYRLNEAFRNIQMFPRPSSLGPPNRTLALADPNGYDNPGQRRFTDSRYWACNPKPLHADPQDHVRAPRPAFDPDLPVRYQMEPLGFGFGPPGNVPQAPSTAPPLPGALCGQARWDFCNHVRSGYSKYYGRSVAASDMVGCAAAPEDDWRLAKMLAAVEEVDAWGNLAHWGCTGTDPGNGLCLDAASERVYCPLSQQCVGGQFPFCDLAPHGHYTFDNPCTACAPDPTRGYCYFLPPARRLIVNPDGIQLVIYDSEDDWANASLALKFALLAYGSPGPGTPADAAANFPETSFIPPEEPLELCNYDRFNDIEVARGGIVDHGPPNPDDAYGHRIRLFTFPRPFAIYLADRNEDVGLASAGCGRWNVVE